MFFKNDNIKNTIIICFFQNQYVSPTMLVVAQNITMKYT